jgi:hypothetical protein
MKLVSQQPTRRLGLILVLAAAALALAAGAAALTTAGNTVLLGVGDFAHVVGPDGPNGIVCGRSPGATPATSIECYLADPKGVHPSTFSGFISDEATVIFYYDENLKYHLVWQHANPSVIGGGLHLDGVIKNTTRTLQSTNAQSGSERTLRVGDSAIVRGSDLHCLLAPDARPVGSVECYIRDANTTSHVVQGSYSILLTPHSIAVYRYQQGSPRRVFFRSEP